MADSKTSDIEQAVAQVDAAAKKGAISATGAANLKAWLTKPAYREYRAPLLKMVTDGKICRARWLVLGSDSVRHGRPPRTDG